MAGLLILGAGGHGTVVADIAVQRNSWDNIAFLDDREDTDRVMGIPIIGKLSDFCLFKSKYSNAVVAIGNNLLRVKWMDKLSASGFIIPNLIHPFSFVSSTSEVREGTVVMAGAVINANAKIGRGCIINTAASIDHDCILKEGVHISPGVHIGGTTTIGTCTWVCIGASIINNINLGKNVIVAAGATIIKNVPDNVMVAGSPATIRRQLGGINSEK